MPADKAPAARAENVVSISDFLIVRGERARARSFASPAKRRSVPARPRKRGNGRAPRNFNAELGRPIIDAASFEAMIDLCVEEFHAKPRLRPHGEPLFERLQRSINIADIVGDDPD